MKISILIFIFSLFFFLHSFAQTDTMVISMKNNQIEKISLSQIQRIRFENITGIGEQSKVKENLSIKGNYPNPFQKQTNIEFEIASPGNVNIIIYDVRGNEVQKLESNECNAGKNIFQWNSQDKNSNTVQSGVYFYEVRFNKEIQSKKMILIK